MSERDRTTSIRRRIGSCTYELRLSHAAADDRAHLTILGCDNDAQVVAELTGILPAAHLRPIATLLRRSSPSPPAYNVAHLRERHPNAYRKWPPEDDERLARLYAEGWPVGRLATEFGRRPGAIRARINKLGLLDTWLPQADLAS